MLVITPKLSIALNEIELTAVRAQGAGGQHVNKASTAIHLRFDIMASSLPEPVKRRLLGRNDQRISADGIVIIKAQEFRSQDQNRQAALQRLQELVRSAAAIRKKRVPTRPKAGASQKRIDAKVRRGRLKSMRKKIRTA